jgi:4-amino-4-deoxy-L-arabinose transferase-like glycosyltransferase
MKTNRFKIITLFLIFLLGLFFRLNSLDTLPPSLFSDEVDILYQVKTLKEQGTDYFGHRFPTHFQSVSDWRTPFQIYSSYFISFFTSKDFLIVRLPSVIFGVLSILVFYGLTGSLLASFIFALNPWSIHYSRTGFEVSGMIFCLLTALLFLKTYLKQKHLSKLLFSLVFFISSAYFYSTAKLFLVLLAPFIIFYLLKNKLLTKNSIIIATIFSLILLSPLILDTLFGRAGYRFSYISIFTEPKREQTVDTLRYQDILKDHSGELGVKTPFFSYLFHNKYQLVIKKFFENYLQSFSTDFLFIRGDQNNRHGFGEHGLLYIFEFFSIIYGIYIFKTNPTNIGKVFLLFLVLAPIPFALTRDSATPHATRLILMLPSLIYFSTLTIKQFPYLLLLYPIFFGIFWDFYQNHYPQNSAVNWHFNLKNTVEATKELSSSYIYFSDSYEPFLPFFLNYYPYPTSKLPLKLNHLDTPEFFGYNLDSQYYFGRLNWANINNLPSNSLLVVPKDETVSNSIGNFRIIKEIPKVYLTGKEFVILKN